MSYYQFKEYTAQEGGEGYGSFEVFYHCGEMTENATPGWYWWACSPGCLPDGDPSGPFANALEAYTDAQNG